MFFDEPYRHISVHFKLLWLYSKGSTETVLRVGTSVGAGDDALGTASLALCTRVRRSCIVLASMWAVAELPTV